MWRPFNVALVGPAKIGKTRMLSENLDITGALTPGYAPTVGVEVHGYEFDGNAVNFWDFAGNPKFSGNVHEPLKKCDVVALFHNGSPSDEWIQKIRESDKPYVIVNAGAFRGENDVKNWVMSLM